MGKRIRAQRIGRGSPTFRTPPVRFATVKIPNWHEMKGGVVKGEVLDIVHEPGRYAPLALVKFYRADGTTEKIWMLATEGLMTGQIVEIGDMAKIKIGNITQLGRIPEGTPVCNIEKHPYDGGKMARAAGTFALIRAQYPGQGKTEIELPGKKRIQLSSECRAQIGIVAGAGKDEKPLVKAGAAFYKWKVKAHIWPRTRGVAMKGVEVRPLPPLTLLITPLVGAATRSLVNQNRYQETLLPVGK